MLEKIAQTRFLSRATSAVRRLVSERGESNAVSMALDVISNYRKLNAEQRPKFFAMLAEQFNIDAEQLTKAAQSFAADPNARNYIRLQKISESPRQELLRRLNRAPGGTAAVVEMRRDLLTLLNKKPELMGLDYDMRHLLSSWFNPGFLKMHRVDWKSPAEILEKIIAHEAVHAIDGWDDLRRRLQPDRRCFAFFHPQLPDEPLIFVEVALLPEIPVAIMPLVDKKSTPVEQSNQFKVAAFYSISNCESGLRGVSMGNFLIKRVAEQLHAEFPGLKTFVTLSPIPGLMEWITAGAHLGDLPSSDKIKPAVRKARDDALELLKLNGSNWMDKLGKAWHPDQCSEREKAAFMALTAIYLTTVTPSRDGNPVAKFHLGNGAKLHQINWAGDLSKNGLRQSAGLMVNYLYDLSSVEENHERFVNGEMIYSRSVSKLMNI
ncbi:malonyl-CoA decarboxylase [Polynucleobacter sp. MWH-UH24A]|jgi:malonyl-CoA decarboxylase|uniref:malonyl-CoA decarboxylase n=1 Tax=Polynucleobacter sp. MWH-UH24A TaxID=2689110 RepID=UPI001BFE3769|nr:malonyl-CoA decarboxylase [Polynucleobacter sp. MWH-UH24A]MBU3727097.1 decarboxylase [Polynucleobacter sp.]NDA16214.1 decarboxylase [Burkholderiaceae bacterium]NDC65132.1 decarboxylase [Burkholderiaceae bacterium]NDH55974.1 decarboxylase [Burkholderiaceae bacterium]QWD75754.1 malonyl-CoA decarboxylase [Polynucleobacter sp. MWH-UH24A]